MKEYSQQEINHLLAENSNCCLYLYTPFCGACQLAEKIITDVSKLFPSLQWGKSNLNFLPSFAQEWKIESVPCLVVFQEKKIIKKIYTFPSVLILYEKIQDITFRKKEDE